jgi:hypothetical protein
MGQCRHTHIQHSQSGCRYRLCFAHRLRSSAPSSPGPQDEPRLVTMALQIAQFRAFFNLRFADPKCAERLRRTLANTS